MLACVCYSVAITLVKLSRKNSSKITRAHTHTGWYLYVHLDDGFSDERRSKESPERHQEVAAGDPSQVEQRVGDLKHTHTKKSAIH